jgi:hypothetical protein
MTGSGSGSSAPLIFVDEADIPNCLGLGCTIQLTAASAAADGAAAAVFAAFTVDDLTAQIRDRLGVLDMEHVLLDVESLQPDRVTAALETAESVGFVRGGAPPPPLRPPPAPHSVGGRGDLWYAISQMSVERQHVVLHA